MRSGSKRTALSLIRIRASGSRRSARAPIGQPSARSARPSRRRNSTRRSPQFGRRWSRRRSKLSPLRVRAVRPHALTHERAGASLPKMRSRDAGQGLCKSRSRDRQGRAVAAPDRNCATSGFPRRTCARLRPGRSPASDSRRVPRGSGASRARAARQDDEAAEIEGEAVVRPGLRLRGFRRDRQRGDPSSVGVPYRAVLCRRIVDAAALRSGGAIDRSPQPGFAIDRRARDVERRAGRAGDGSGYVRAARTVGQTEDEAMTQREIVGPQERFERSGAQRLRDIRPITTRLWSAMMSEFSGVVLAGGAMAMFVEPALVNFAAPASLLYAGLVMSRRVMLPLRLPQTAGIRDWNYRSPVGRRPRMAAGSIYLGHDLKGRELWISSEDGRQHATVPGTTGAGKTTALLSFLTNALTHASGFVLVDGKADNKLYGEVLALARRFGR